jgi:hypothetical protein
VVDVLHRHLDCRHHIFDQRVGAAVSDALHRWRRVRDQPALSVDRRWYKTLHLDPPGTTGPDLTLVSETWRDPLVLPDPDGDGWHMLSLPVPSVPAATTTASSRTRRAVTSPPGSWVRRCADPEPVSVSSRCCRAR